MSRPQREEISCPQCGVKSPFIVWSSLNVTLDPDQKPRLLNGELTRFTCAACGHKAEVKYALLYHDMERKVMFWHIPRDPSGKPSDAPDDLGASQQMRKAGYIFRRVDSLNRLKEKIFIADHSLDDQVVELAKLLLVHLSPKDKMPAGAEVFFDRIVEEPERGRMLSFAIVSPTGNSAALAPFADFYDKLAGQFASDLARQPDEPWPAIDQEFAVRLFTSKRGDGASTAAASGSGSGSGSGSQPPAYPTASPATSGKSARPWWRFW